MVPAHGKGDACLLGPEGPVAASFCEVKSLELLLVQPACLQTDGCTDPRQQTSTNATSTSNDVCLHRLKVHLQVGLTGLQGQHLKEATVESCDDHHKSLVRLQHAVLELVVLDKQTHVLLSQQYSLLQLLQQQEQDSQVMQSQRSAVASTNEESNWTIPLQLYITVPCKASENAIDFINMVVISKSTLSAVQQQHEGHTQLHDITPEAVSHQQQVYLLAETPFLLLPDVAHQELQQLLLPAMRQEAQATVVGNDLQVEQAVWQHLQQLMHDLYAVVLLARLLADPAAKALAASIAAEAAAEAASEAAVISERAVQWGAGTEALPAASPESDCPLAPDTSLDTALEPTAMPSEAALDEVADVMLFPILLPFLAAHGLHNLLRLLVACLPVNLQQRWEQQQRARLQVKYKAVAEQMIEVLDSPSEQKAEPPAAAAIDSSKDAVQLQHQVDDALLGSDPEQHPFKTAVPAVESEQQQEQQQCPEQHIKEKPGVPDDVSAKPTATASTASASTGQQGTEGVADGASAAATIPCAAWYSPLTQFNCDGERRYLTWKHHSLLHLDYIGALFAVMYMLALLKRMISEPTTLFYFIYVLLKCLPLVPLILGFRTQFLRYRELWLWLVIPASLLTFLLLTAVQKIADPTALLPRKAIAAYWRSRGELVTSTMRPFIQHMRVRPYVVYTLADAVMVAWVFAQFYGWWAAVGRWGFAAMVSIGLCWGLDLHMRRKFVAVEQRMRA